MRIIFTKKLILILRPYRNLIILGGTFCITIIFFIGDVFKNTEAAPEDTGMMSQVTPSVSINIKGATNSRGKRTILSKSAINFGAIMFSQPEQITNGDAYLDEKKHLNLEATLQIEGVFGGINGVSYFISQLAPNNQSFSKMLFSLGTRRNDQDYPVPNFPERRAIRESVENSDPFNVRVIGIILPTQTGVISSTFRIDTEIAN